MTSSTKRAEAIFAGGAASTIPPKWEQIRDEEKARRQVLLEKQRTARLVRETAMASAKAKAAAKAAPAPAPTKTPRRRKQVRSAG